MAEKGGKGFAAAKTALKSPDSSGPRTNSFEKTGRKDTPVGKGDWGKGRKGDKTGSGGKSPVTKPPPPLELKVELPANAECLMDCEAAQILEGIQEQMVMLSEDPTIKIPIPFDRGLQYAKRGGYYTNPKSVRQVLEPLKKHGVSDSEMCMIANICPESVDEIFALVPSFKSKKSKLREPLKNALDELTKLKRPT